MRSLSLLESMVGSMDLLSAVLVMCSVGRLGSVGFFGLFFFERVADCNWDYLV